MGARLVDYFERAAAQYGAVGRMKLAMLTSISSAKAASEADSPENIKKFDLALEQLQQTMKA